MLAFGGVLLCANGEARGPGWVGVDEGGGCIRCRCWGVIFMFVAFIGNDGALVVGIKFGGRPAETGTFAYADPEYGV